MNADPRNPKLLEELADAIRACHRCELAKHRIASVPGCGPINAKIFFVGEAPNPEAEKQGTPFAGAYKLAMEQCLNALELNPEDIYITDVVKCVLRDSEGKVDRSGYGPGGSSIPSCRYWLDQEIRLVNPRIIVMVGSAATNALFNESISAFRNKGYSREANGRFYLAMYHLSGCQRRGIVNVVDEKKDELDELRALLHRV
jgi:DNA polymerase